MFDPGRLSRWLPVALWAALISLFSTGWFTGERTGAVLLPILAVLFPGASASELGAIHHAVRKLAHFTEYLVLSVLLYRALSGGRRWDARAAGLALALAGTYALADELHQWFAPARGASPLDCLVDVAGAIVGQGLVAATRRRVSRDSARRSRL